MKNKNFVKQQFGHIITIHPDIYYHFVHAIKQPISDEKRAEKHALWWMVTNLTSIKLHSLEIDDVEFIPINDFSRDRSWILAVPFWSEEFGTISEDQHEKHKTLIDSIPVRFVDLMKCDWNPNYHRSIENTVTVKVPKDIKPLDRERIMDPIKVEE